MRKPKEIWAFWASTYGPTFKLPQKVKSADSGSSWWHKEGDHEVTQIGLEDRGGYICFAHPDKQRVKDFMAGFNAARKVMREFVNDSGSRE